MNQPTSAYPTAWQRKTIWAALAGLCVLLLITIAGSFVWAIAFIVGHLQPVVIPIAIAGILAYLLDPVVTRMTRRGLSRTWAVVFLFLGVAVATVMLTSWVVPMISIQGENFAKELPAYTLSARDRVVDVIYRYDKMFGVLGGPRGKSASSTFTNWLLGASPAPNSKNGSGPGASPNGTASSTPIPTPSETISSATPEKQQPSQADRERLQNYVEKNMRDFERDFPTWSGKIWNAIKTSIGGVLGVTGFLLSLILVPIYLFFFLKERPRIEARWKEYLPLRDSPLKEEVAEVISQINHYVIAYFRGQLLVCLVDGCLIGSILTIYPGLNFAPLIGCLVVVLTMIPYIGIVLCWIPAVLIAAFQFGDWTHPLIVTAIFFTVQTLEGNFYAPRIIGDSVGLHPLTVIVSIFVWGLLIGGVLGPILAVPLTATIKVLLARYVWGRRLRERVMESIEQVPVVKKA